MNEQQDYRRISYESGAVFLPVCIKCGRFVKADKTILINEDSGEVKGQNATCSKCGRIEMYFEGFYGDED